MIRQFAAGLCLAALALLPPVAGVAALLGASAGDGGPLLAIHAPWTDAGAMAQAAGGRLIGPAAPAAVLVASDSPGFADRLRAAGAWLVVDGAALARICGTDRAWRRDS